MKKFEQADKFDGVDCTVFDIRKFVALAADCNPNIIEMLYTDKDDHLVNTEIRQMLVENRQLFLSKKARWTFSGYAIAQLKRINGHYKWLKNPPTHKPTRTEFKLPERTIIAADQFQAIEALIRKRIDSWNLDLRDLEPARRLEIQSKIDEILVSIVGSSLHLGDIENLWKCAVIYEGLSTNFILIIQKEKEYKAKLTEWNQYQEWLANRNKNRACIEAKYGYDCKHGMHLVRLMRMCKEILTTGKVIIKRPDAAELRDIRNGSWSYEKLIEWSNAVDGEIDELYNKSSLPKSPDMGRINDLLVSVVQKFIG